MVAFQASSGSCFSYSKYSGTCTAESGWKTYSAVETDNVKLSLQKITANVNEKNGYSQAFCVKCLNDFATVEVKGFTLK